MRGIVVIEQQLININRKKKKQRELKLRVENLREEEEEEEKRGEIQVVKSINVVIEV